MIINIESNVLSEVMQGEQVIQETKQDNSNEIKRMLVKICRKKVISDRLIVSNQVIANKNRMSK